MRRYYGANDFIQRIQNYPNKTCSAAGHQSYGEIFGGTILSYIDEIATIAAMRHSKKVVVTASIDTVNFLSSAKSGDILTLEAFVISTGRTLMKVFVKVECQHLDKSETKLTTTSTLTLVALDHLGKPSPVPKVKLESDMKKEWFAQH